MPSQFYPKTHPRCQIDQSSPKRHALRPKHQRALLTTPTSVQFFRVTGANCQTHRISLFVRSRCQIRAQRVHFASYSFIAHVPAWDIITSPIDAQPYDTRSPTWTQAFGFAPPLDDTVRRLNIDHPLSQRGLYNGTPKTGIRYRVTVAVVWCEHPTPSNRSPAVCKSNSVASLSPSEDCRTYSTRV
ncbi:hypothetical protein N657DRAFT_219494 [Parathielavia appendiculata]|uniref:Uncharacterized protein n=1 Tax=Parathielavia appendiculata TaxID=2587402 RepID=A0AAN6U7V0_9PEZI|nr:hypothetical protein N657DRAFT_219494 [Parathielavia appendiculata]